MSIKCARCLVEIYMGNLCRDCRLDPCDICGGGTDPFHTSYICLLCTNHYCRSCSAKHRTNLCKSCDVIWPSVGGIVRDRFSYEFYRITEIGYMSSIDNPNTKYVYTFTAPSFETIKRRAMEDSRFELKWVRLVREKSMIQLVIREPDKLGILSTLALCLLEIIPFMPAQQMKACISVLYVNQVLGIMEDLSYFTSPKFALKQKRERDS